MAEVLGRYSNLGPRRVRLEQAREMAEKERREEPWQSPQVSRVTQVRRLMAVEIEAMVVDYRAGMGCVLLARKYGVSDNTVLVHLKAAGVEIRRGGKFSAKDDAELRRLRAAGWTQQRLADRFGVTRAAVSLRLRVGC